MARLIKALFGLPLIRDEFEQRSVRIAEIDARPLTFCAVACDRSKLDRHPARRKMRDRPGNRADPLETEVAVAGSYRVARDRDGLDARPVEIELRVTEAVDKALVARNDPGAEDTGIKIVRARPIRDMHDTMIQFHTRCHKVPLCNDSPEPGVCRPRGRAHFHKEPNP